MIKKEPLFLLSNDDGVNAAGLMSLLAGLKDLGEIVVVAPDTERSASGHAITISGPLRIKNLSENIFSVTGTPADCVMVAFHNNFLKRKPSWVLSGINKGGNTGTDTIYSGTVAAALEGAINNCRGMAISLDRIECAKVLRYETAVKIVRILLENELLLNVKDGEVLNVNVPNIPFEDILGIKAATIGKRIYNDAVQSITDPKGKPFVWIGGGKRGHHSIAGSDCNLIDEGYVTLSILRPSYIDDSATKRLSGALENGLNDLFKDALSYPDELAVSGISKL